LSVEKPRINIEMYLNLVLSQSSQTGPDKWTLFCEAWPAIAWQNITRTSILGS